MNPPPEKPPSRWQQLWQRIFPQMPDFYAMLQAQCMLAERCTATLAAYMRNADPVLAEQVRTLESEGDRLKAKHLATLHHAFATPIDREDIYQSIAAIDEILNYAKSTVSEMQVLSLSPDEHTTAMADLMHSGAQALQRGYALLASQPLAAEPEAVAAYKTERATEQVYRKALAELFDPQHYLTTLTEAQKQDAAALTVLTNTLSAQESAGLTPAVGFMLEVLKRREVYRHMSNGADRVARVAEVLLDIVAKVA